MAFAPIAKTSDVKPGEGKVVEVNGKILALFNVDGRFYTIDNTCQHKGGPLGEGILEGAIVTCPWHGWKYDVTSGKCVTIPNIKVASFPTKVEGDNVMVDWG